MVLEIFIKESANSTIKYKLEYKFGGFHTWKQVPDITDYKLEFVAQTFKNLNEIQHTEIFEVIKFWSGKITEFSR